MCRSQRKQLAHSSAGWRSRPGDSAPVDLRPAAQSPAACPHRVGAQAEVRLRDLCIMLLTTLAAVSDLGLDLRISPTRNRGLPAPGFGVSPDGQSSLAGAHWCQWGEAERERLAPRRVLRRWEPAEARVVGGHATWLSPLARWQSAGPRCAGPMGRPILAEAPAPIG